MDFLDRVSLHFLKKKVLELYKVLESGCKENCMQEIRNK